MQSHGGLKIHVEKAQADKSHGKSCEQEQSAFAVATLLRET